MLNGANLYNFQIINDFLRTKVGQVHLFLREGAIPGHLPTTLPIPLTWCLAELPLPPRHSAEPVHDSGHYDLCHLQVRPPHRGLRLPGKLRQRRALLR